MIKLNNIVIPGYIRRIDTVCVMIRGVVGVRLNIVLMMTAIMIMVFSQMDMRRRPLHCKEGSDQEQKQYFVKTIVCHVDS